MSGWNLTAVDYPKDVSLHGLIEAQVSRTPDTPAVVFDGITLTYRELNERANGLAYELNRLGVKPEIPVAICMERSLEMVVGLLAILKAGGAYMPLDPRYPLDRLAFMLEDAGAPVLLTQGALLERLPAYTGHIIDLTRFEKSSSENPGMEVRPENLAYVIYTSGSTGTPKGVMSIHRGICNRLFWMQQEYGLTSEDRVMQKTPFTFDVSVWEFFWPMMTGAQLVVALPGGHMDSAYLIRTIREQGITTIHFVPSMLNV
ncbi:MAG TPA: AMP-binding protein, partial [Phototrophicaceae bacterium]|nr:AMP-binding protein [Phototrophicaceae bacterium]